MKKVTAGLAAAKEIKVDAVLVAVSELGGDKKSKEWHWRICENISSTKMPPDWLWPEFKGNGSSRLAAGWWRVSYVASERFKLFQPGSSGSNKSDWPALNMMDKSLGQSPFPMGTLAAEFVK